MWVQMPITKTFSTQKTINVFGEIKGNRKKNRKCQKRKKEKGGKMKEFNPIKVAREIRFKMVNPKEKTVLCADFTKTRQKQDCDSISKMAKVRLLTGRTFRSKKASSTRRFYLMWNSIPLVRISMSLSRPVIKVVMLRRVSRTF